MWFVCPKCKTPFKIDLREKCSKYSLTKKGYYKSCCSKSGKIEYCKPEKK